MKQHAPQIAAVYRRLVDQMDEVGRSAKLWEYEQNRARAVDDLHDLNTELDSLKREAKAAADDAIADVAYSIIQDVDNIGTILEGMTYERRATCLNNLSVFQAAIGANVELLMHWEGSQKRCEVCNADLIGRDADRSQCGECRKPDGKLEGLSIALNTMDADKYPERMEQIADWPKIRAWMRDEFGPQYPPKQLFAFLVDRILLRLKCDEYDVLKMRTGDVVELIESGGLSKTLQSVVSKDDASPENELRAEVLSAMVAGGLAAMTQAAVSLPAHVRANEVMQSMMDSDRTYDEWIADQWVVHLKVTKQTVLDTDAWKGRMARRQENRDKRKVRSV